MNVIEQSVKYGSNFDIGNFNTISGNVTIGDNVKIGSNCVISGNINIGNNTIIENGVVLVNNVTLGENNYIYSGCKIGYHPQHISGADKIGLVIIGNGNIFRENCTVHLPYSSASTSIGDNNFFMVNAHVSHDACLYSNIVVSNNVVIAGHVIVHDFANIGLNTCIHQFVRIGHFAMIGMGSSIAKDVLPFYMVAGSRNIKTSLNVIGFKRKYKGNIKLRDIISYFEFVSKNKVLFDSVNEDLNEKISLFKNSVRGFYS